MITLRAFIGLSLFLAMISLVVTAIYLFIQPHNQWIVITHIFTGFWLFMLLGFHIKNNFKPLGNYLFKKHNRFGYFMPVLSLSVALVLLVMFYRESEPFKSIYIWSQQIRTNVDQVEQEQQVFTLHQLRLENAKGLSFNLEFRKGSNFMWPQYAFWLETMDGKFIQPLYITQKLAGNGFANKVTKKDPGRVFTENPFTTGEDENSIFAYEWDPATKDNRMRPESLPVFLHALGIQSKTGQFFPEDMPPEMDAYAGATFMDNFVLGSQAMSDLPRQFKLRFEINQSFDFNEYYSSDRFPDDPIYSGDGYSAQPSVIYELEIDLDNPQPVYAMRLIGHGHHSGHDGNVNPDLSLLTSAKKIVDRIIVEIKSSSDLIE